MRLNPIHTSSGPLTDALAALPHWRQAREQLERLDAMDKPAGLGDARQAVNDALAAELDTSAPQTGRLMAAGTLLLLTGCQAALLDPRGPVGRAERLQFLQLGADLRLDQPFLPALEDRWRQRPLHRPAQSPMRGAVIGG